MTKLEQLQKMIDDLVVAMREYDGLKFDEEYSHELGKPCTADQIIGLEHVLGKPLPPSYRTFMELHNGWSNFSGGAKLLAVEDYGSEWLEELKEDLDELFSEDEVEGVESINPFTTGAIPVLLGEDEWDYLVLDPNSVRQDGEMDFVLYELTKEEARFTNFSLFLQYKLNLYHEMIEDEKKGIVGEED